MKFLEHDFDHVHVTANYKAMRKLNKLGLIKKGSPYYGWLVSIFSVVVRVALQYKINLVFYAEDGEIEYGGSTQNKNKPIFDAKYMVKNYLEGGHHKILKESKINKKDLYWFDFPEKEFKKNKISLTHLSYFEPWDSYRNYLISKDKPLITSKYGKWKTAFQHVMVIVILLINDPTQEIINLIVTFNAIYAAGTGIHYMVKNGF